MADKAPPTYEELAALRAEEWAAAQARAAKDLADYHAELAQMPDVRHAPELGATWSHPAIVCPCGGTTFRVQRWNTVNGLRHRAELACVACPRVETWDWATMMWMG
jgi:hypothetical protein